MVQNSRVHRKGDILFYNTDKKNVCEKNNAHNENTHIQSYKNINSTNNTFFVVNVAVVFVVIVIIAIAIVVIFMLLLWLLLLLLLMIMS